MLPWSGPNLQNASPYVFSPRVMQGVKFDGKIQIRKMGRSGQLRHLNKRSTMYAFPLIMIGLVIMFLVHSGCYKEEFITDENAVVQFSTDTVAFDTVLTEVSTVTRSLKVYNPYDESILISRLELSGMSAGFFNINADGSSGDVLSNIEINPRDSIYVYVEATIDPDQPVSVSPFVIEAKLVFDVNEQQQEVILVAWGQNANYIPGPNTPNRVSYLSCDLGIVTWDDPKPYVLYGVLLIDSCTLVLPPGTKLYVHGGIANNELGIYNEGWIYTNRLGKIEAVGSLEDPVIISDDRIEPDYEGEWIGIRLGPESGPHRFSHTRIQNSQVGIYADSSAVIDVDHSIISYTSGPGIFARHATARISNSLFYENGTQAIALTYGGDYEIDYCTMANYGNNSEALVINNYYCDDPLCSSGVFVNKLSLLLNNSIMVGSSTDEVWMVNAGMPTEDVWTVEMFNSVVVVDDLLDEDNFPDFFESVCLQCVEYQLSDLLFEDFNNNDFHLDSLSIAQQIGKPLIDISDDLEGKVRHAQTPDAGCYEDID